MVKRFYYCMSDYVVFRVVDQTTATQSLIERPICALWHGKKLVRDIRIELMTPTWKDGVLPLYKSRESFKRHSLAPSVRCVVCNRQAQSSGWGYTSVERPVV